MPPWMEELSAGLKPAQFQIDALGLITILGTNEIDASVGRLVPSRYVDFLPLMSAFVLASNQFVKKQPNFTLYNLSGGIRTSELAGWFSRWLSMQDFHQIHHTISWHVEARPERLPSRVWMALAVSILCHGFLLALAALLADWWGLVNVFAMILSVLVRTVLVWQNGAGIDTAIEPLSQKLKSRAKVLVVTDDSKVITMDIPESLIGPIFTRTPEPPNPTLYRFSRWVGWAAFAAHITSIGMATLPTQICTVILMIVSTILTSFKFGCDDWRMRKRVAEEMERLGPNDSAQMGWPSLVDKQGVSCFISPNLKAVCSEHPLHFEREIGEYPRVDASASLCEASDEEAQQPQVGLDVSSERKRTERRRDLFLWLNLSEEELDHLKAWNLTPRGSEQWWKEFYEQRTQRFMQTQAMDRARESREQAPDIGPEG